VRIDSNTKAKYTVRQTFKLHVLACINWAFSDIFGHKLDIVLSGLDRKF